MNPTTGVTFIKDEKGAATHVVIDWQRHGKLIGALLEELEDAASIEATKDEETVSLAAIRKELIAAGASDDQLASSPEDV